MAAPVRILHLHSTFDLGGKEARAVRLMNAFGGRAVHVVQSATPGALGARKAIDPSVQVTFPADRPALTGKPSLRRWRAIAHAMRPFDLVLTYNWGAMDAVMARRLFGGPPLVHHEDGFNADEADRQKLARMLFRRLALAAARALVVPSIRLEDIARKVWRQPAARVHRIGNGIPVDRYAAPPDLDAVPGYRRRPDRTVVGTVAGLRGVKNLPLLVRSVARAGDNIDLLIIGEGPERDAIRAEAERCDIADRLYLPGFLAEPDRYIGLFDIFALTSDSEQQPIAVMEAMAAGLPIVATRVGDVAAMLAPENRPFLADPGDAAGLAGSIRRLADDPALCRKLGEANRTVATKHHAESTMIGAYRSLYETVLSRVGALA